jgi:hypothetical protein
MSVTMVGLPTACDIKKANYHFLQWTITMFHRDDIICRLVVVTVVTSQSLSRRNIILRVCIFLYIIAFFVSIFSSHFLSSFCPSYLFFFHVHKLIKEFSIKYDIQTFTSVPKMSQPVILILSYLSAVCIALTFKIYFNIILSFEPVSRGLFPSRYSD